MVLVHQPPVSALDLAVARRRADAEHLVGALEIRRRAMVGLQALVRPDQSLDLRELDAAHAERARDTPKEPPLREIDRSGRDRSLHLDLDEGAAEIRAAVELPCEL